MKKYITIAILLISQISFGQIQTIKVQGMSDYVKVADTSSMLNPYLPKNGIAAGTNISFTGTGTSADPIVINSSSSGGSVTSVAALTLGTSGTDLSSSVANSTTTPVITLNVPTASASNRGALSSTDWSTFNNKVGVSSPTNGDILYYNSGWQKLAIGTSRQTLHGGTIPVWIDTSAGGSSSAAGNYGNIQINRNGLFATPASDSLGFKTGTLTNLGSSVIKGTLTVMTTAAGADGTDSTLVQNNGLVKKASPHNVFSSVKSATGANQFPLFVHATDSSVQQMSSSQIVPYISGSTYSNTTGYSATSFGVGLDIANQHNSGGANQFSSLQLSASGNAGSSHAIGIINAIQEGAGANPTSMAFQVRGSVNYVEFMRALSSGKVGIGTATPRATFQDSGSLALNYISKTATYTASNDWTIEFTSGSNDTAFLPTPSSANSCLIYTIKNSSTGIVTVATAGGALIDGGASYKIAVGGSSIFQSTGNGTWISLCASLPAPVILATIDGIDAKTVALTTLYSVPTGKSVYVTGIVVRCSAATSITVPASVSVYTVSPNDIFTSTALTGLTLTTKYFSQPITGASTVTTAGNTIKFSVDIAATGTSQTFSVDLIGYSK